MFAFDNYHHFQLHMYITHKKKYIWTVQVLLWISLKKLMFDCRTLFDIGYLAPAKIIPIVRSTYRIPHVLRCAITM